MLHSVLSFPSGHHHRRIAERLPHVTTIVSQLRPVDPVMCIRPATLAATARQWVAAFPGHVHYAVKCNPDPAILRLLHAGGVDRFDVASLAEIELVRRVAPTAALAFMHPVKTRSAIRAAYHHHGVRDFALDTRDELCKILAETDHARDLGLHVRLRLPKGGAVYDLSGKFGAAPDQAIALLRHRGWHVGHDDPESSSHRHS